jgi:hypothetical protein
MFRNWWKRWQSSRHRTLRQRRPGLVKPIRRTILHLEPLEDRTLPSFAAPTAFDLGSAPHAVATGHFEGAKAPLDVVTANANGTVSVLLGKGDGTLQNPISISVGGSPDAVAVGDFLGNGLQDIAVANGNGTVDVILSNGNGTFQTPQVFTLGATPVGIAVGDFLGNGKLDLVTANSNGSVSVLEGNGKGGFGAPINTQVGGSLTSVAVGDFNNDGKVDVVVGTNTGLDTLLSNGNGTFQLKQTVTFSHTVHGIFTFTFGVSSVAVSDLRGDGKEDVVALTGEGLSLLLGNGNGTVQSPTFLDGGPSTVASFVVGDFNGDGKPDIVTSALAQDPGVAPAINVLTGKGDGTFQTGSSTNVGETANALAAGDFGTGKIALVMVSSNSVTLVPGNGNGTFATAPTIATNNGPTLVAAADFNGDGKTDLVTAGFGSVVVSLSNGNGTFSPGTTLSIDGNATALAVGDFTGNGKQDIAVAAGGTIDVFLGNGNGTFQSPTVINLGNVDIRSLVAGNFVKGGLLDLAATVFSLDGTGTSTVQVLNNAGKGTFTVGQSVNVGTQAEGLAIADFNGDGKLDLVTTSSKSDGTPNVEVLLGNGDGTFQKPIVTNPGFGARFVATGDFNGDGKADLVLSDANNTLMVLQGNGDGTFGKPLTFNFQTSLGDATPVVGNFFGDGKQSIALVSGHGLVTVLRGNGDGTFQAPASYLIDFTGNQASALVAADFNGDGKLALAAASSIDGTVSVLLNNTPAPATGTIATTTTLSADATTAVFGQPVTLAATVKATSGTATGSILFFDGSTLLGTVALDPNGQARLLVQLGLGNHSLKAVFAGIAPFTNSTSAVLSETVNQDATTSTLTVNTNLFGAGFVQLTDTIIPVAPGGGSPTGTVTFMEGNTVLGTAQVSGGQASLNLRRSLAPGKHTVRAIYSGDADFLASNSPDLTFTVA